MASGASLPLTWQRWYRPSMFGIAALLLVAAAAIWLTRWNTAVASGVVALDYRTFVEEGHRFLAGGPVYLPYQLAGPYDAAPAVARTDPATVPFLYPPAFIAVGVTLTVLPSPAWWATPVALLAYALYRWRPGPWTWPLLAAVLIWPATSAVFIVGGTTMWVAALTAAGLIWRWPAAFILLKPSFVPIALIGIRDWRWWAVAISIGVLSLPLLSEYLTALRNAQGVSLLYSLGDLPIVLAPVVAWLGRSR